MVQEVCNKALAYSYSEIRTIERTLIMLKKKKRKGLNSTSGASFAALPLVKRVV